MQEDLDKASELLLDQARRQLLQQQADIDALRNRAIATISALSLVSGLFGSQLLGARPSGWDAVCITVASASFGIGIVLVILISAPRRNWIFSFRLDRLHQLVEDVEALPLDISYNLAVWMEEARAHNAPMIREMNILFSVLCLLAGIEVIAWCSTLLN